VHPSSSTIVIGPAKVTTPVSTITASESIPSIINHQNADIRRVETPTSAIAAPLVVNPQFSVNSIAEPSSIDVHKPSAEAFGGRVRLLSAPTKVAQSGEPLPQQSKPAEHTSISGATASESSMPVISSGLDSQRHLQPHPEVRTFVSRTNAWVCSNSQHRGQTPLCGLLHRKDVEVKRICKKLIIDQNAVFIVRRKST
jgi:hypothetical protein